jgi:hypothetical protein
MHPAGGQLASWLARGARRAVARPYGDGELGRVSGERRFSTAFAPTALLAASVHASVGSIAPRQRPHVPQGSAAGLQLASFTTAGLGRDSSVMYAEQSAVSGGETESLKKPLAFVNRYAEALDVLVPNLDNQECVRDGLDVKFSTPLAAQPPGTGKTALGRNVTAILRRPREADVETEAHVAERLRTAWCWGGEAAKNVDEALRDGRDENLVVRTLLAIFPHQHDTVLRLKRTEPLVLQMKGLVTPRFGLDFDGALAYAIFCNARGLRGSRPETRAAFLAQDLAQQSAVGVVEKVIEERGGDPLLLVLDDITDLGHTRFAEYFHGEAQRTPLHRAMTELSISLQLLHAIPRCFVYCTGRSLWLSSRALIGSTSPLIVQPTLLQPLSAADIKESLMTTTEPSGHPLLDSMRIAPHMVDYFASRAQALTGGIGRVLQFLLRARQREVINSSSPALLQSREEVDAVLERLMPRLAKIPGMVLRVDWDGPSAAAAAGEVPAWASRQDQQERLLLRLARMLVLDSSFDPDACIDEVGGSSMRVSDAAVVLGLSYGPAPAPASDAPAAVADGRSSRTHLRLIAGEWLTRSLLAEPFIADRPALLTSVQLLATMHSFGGTMRGRPFELLCADALCFRSFTKSDAELRSLLPHLSLSARGSDRVPRLQVLALPKAVDAARRLSDDAKAALLRHRERWAGAKTISTHDLPWLLSEWLPVGCLGVPADAQSGSQDLFLRLGGGVVGFALKAASASSGTGWSDVRDELAKAPALPPHVPYTLVLWSLHLAPQLRAALGSATSAVYDHGNWRQLRSGTLQKRKARHTGGDAFTVTVAASQELVIANPHAPCGGGLRELLGSGVFNKLHGMTSSSAAHEIAHLAEWMPSADVDVSVSASASAPTASA